jgi:hypothetical protein
MLFDLRTSSAADLHTTLLNVRRARFIPGRRATSTIRNTCRIANRVRRFPGPTCVDPAIPEPQKRKETSMRRVALVLVTLCVLAAVAAPTEAAPRPARPSKAKTDGVWYKRDGWLGYGWYSIYGDYRGSDGYTYIRNRYPSPANPGGWFIGAFPIQQSGYGRP